MKSLKSDINYATQGEEKKKERKKKEEKCPLLERSKKESFQFFSFYSVQGKENEDRV